MCVLFSVLQQSCRIINWFIVGVNAEIILPQLGDTHPLRHLQDSIQQEQESPFRNYLFLSQFILSSPSPVKLNLFHRNLEWLFIVFMRITTLKWKIHGCFNYCFLISSCPSLTQLHCKIVLLVSQTRKILKITEGLSTNIRSVIFLAVIILFGIRFLLMIIVLFLSVYFSVTLADSLHISHRNSKFSFMKLLHRFVPQSDHSRNVTEKVISYWRGETSTRLPVRTNRAIRIDHIQF